MNSMKFYQKIEVIKKEKARYVIHRCSRVVL